MSGGLYNYDPASPTRRFNSASGASHYPDPFLSYSTFLMPKSISEVLRWCEHIWFRNGTYSRAMQRVISYFLTSVEVNEASDSEKDKYEDFLNNTLNIKTTLLNLGLDYMCYGNSFSSIYIPFKRFLSCPKCKIEIPIDSIDYQFTDCKFLWSCKHCKSKIKSKKPIDRRSVDESDIKVKRWSPHELNIMHHPISGDKLYLWDPPADIVKKIKQGDRFYIRYFPWEMIESICADKMFEFAPKVIYQMLESSLAGVETGGWGISQVVPNFTQAYYVQLAKLYNEILMQEFVIPFRVVTPKQGNSSQGDPLIGNMGNHNAKLLGMLDAHRREPGKWHSLPFPVEYQALSGEGLQVTTYDHISAATDELLNASGVPTEFYKGTISFQALPSALRLFQNSWPQIPAQFNGWLNWLMEILATVFNWDQAEARLTPVTIADDIEKKSIMLQLLAGNQISKETALSPLGIDSDDELKRIIDERKELMEAEDEFNKELEQKQLLQQQFSSGGMSAALTGGVQSPQGMSGTSITPEDMQMQAEQEAIRLLGMPYEQRRSEMSRLKKSNETLHSLVKGKMQNIRQDAQREGGYQMIQTMASGAQQPPA